MNKILSLLEPGITVITATERLAREARSLYAESQKQNNHTAWTSPDIYNFLQYIESTWLDMWPESQMINDVHEYHLLQRIINQTHGTKLLTIEPTVKAALNTYHQCLKYKIDFKDSEFGSREESETFVDWIEELESKKSELHLVNRLEIIQFCIDSVDEYKGLLPKHVFMVGFLDLPPLYKSFFDAIESAETQVTFYNSPEKANVSLVRHNTTYDELYGIASDISDKLKPYVNNPSDAPSIGVVVPSIQTYREKLDYAFTEAISPRLLVESADDTEKPWRFTIGRALAQLPLVEYAQSILRLQAYDNSFEDISVLLLNPLFISAEREGLAELEVYFRTRGYRRISLKQIIRYSEDTPISNGYAPVFAETAQKLLELQRTEQENALPSEWAVRFTQRLEIFQWGLQATLDGSQQQAIEAWNIKLQSLGSLDGVIGSISYSKAMDVLNMVLGEALFMPRSDYAPNIHIMELWDIPDHQYDYLYVISLDASKFPARAMSNPFIPYSLMKDAKMPGSSPDVEHDRAAKAVSYIKRSADNVIISCPFYSDDGRDLSASSFFDGWEVKEDNAKEVNVLPLYKTNGTFENVDETIIPVSAEEAIGIKGGVRTLSLHASASFFSFTESRLGVQPFKDPSNGVSPRMQGKCIHAVLEYFWQKVRTSKKLKAMSKTELDAFLNNIIYRVYDNEKLIPHGILPEPVLELERKRTHMLASTWLKFEAERTDDFEVVTTEHRLDININGLPVNIVIDRIDKISTDDGDKFLVWDYKTGNNVYPQGWNVDTLTDPQLPIYASLADLTSLNIERVDGIAFGHITEGKCTAHLKTNWCDNFVSRKIATQDVVSSWPQQIDDWKSAIEDLVSSFMEGENTISEKDFNKYSFMYEHLIDLVREPELLSVITN